MANEAFEVNGKWWLPEKPANAVVGRLSYDPDKGTELVLAGTLKSYDEKSTVLEDGSIQTELTESSLDGSYPLIHGQSGSSAFTLIDCFRTKGSAHFPSMQEEEIIRANSAIKGAWFDGDPMDAEGVSVSTRYLSHWIDIGGFEEDLESTPSGELTKTLRITQRPAEQADLANGMKCTLVHGIGWAGEGIVSRELSQNYKFTIRNSALVELQDLLDMTSDFQDLVSVGTGRIAEYTHIWFSRPDVQEQTLAGTDVGELALHYYARWNVRDNAAAKKLAPHEMYFSYGDLGGMSGVKQWLDCAADYRSLLSAVMATSYSESMFVSDRLLNRAAALESFDKTVTGYQGSNFKTRIERCGKLAGPEFLALLGTSAEEWAKAVKFERDDIAHHLGRHIRRDAPDLYFLAESLYWAFVLCFLRQMNAPQAVFTRIMKHQQWGFLGPKVTAAIKTVAAMADAEDSSNT
ncbi:HEPN domain-containing protein [Kribbella sp. NPDC006257]|uniref:ApeA N-terminal domain 1-containing protein n=1 Tax=Kribbella sp. NPDC006257 TaxID=3156738 RepID=UPI0033B8F76B